MLSSEANELPRVRGNGSSFGSRGDGDATTAAELEQLLIAQLAQRPENGVRIDAEDSREVPRRRETFSRTCLAIGDGAADLRGHLLVELERLVPGDLDTKHGASDTSFIC